MRKIAIIFGLIFFGLLGGGMTAADNGSAVEEAQTIGRTPPRLSFLDGQVSFWRPGAQDWTQAQINTALAPGDQLYIQGDGNLELQIGAQAFVRGGRDAQIGLETQEPDFLRFKVTGGRVAFDLRALAPGRMVEVDTPHGAITMDHAGYFRLEVGDQRTTFTTRRTGRATVTAGGDDAVAMEPDESVTIEGPSGKTLAFQAAPPMDAWDTWNYDRTDALLEAASARYVPSDTYGTADLDRYGSWRVLPTYGAVWVPAGVAPGWAPYSTGSWMHDPYYGWTWVDTAPWGWAPYHYGRWMYVNSYWCWAPGPVVRHAIYAPALVAFYGAPGVSVGISIGGPAVGWVALGWGEPLIPWWGRPGFIHRPWWGGWRGPRCINGRVIHHGRVVTVHDIRHYHNTRIHSAMVVVDRDRFGHGRIKRRHLREGHQKHWRPAHRGPGIRPMTAGFSPSTRHGRRPPERILNRSTVTYRPRHAQKPAVSRRERDVRRFSDQSGQDRRTSWGHGRSYDRKPPKTFGPRSKQPSGPDSRRPTAAMGAGGGRRNVTAPPHRGPATGRTPTRHIAPRTREPDHSVKSQRRSGDSSASRRTTLSNDRSKAPERPSRHYQRPSSPPQQRIAAPSPSPAVRHPKVNTGRRNENHSVAPPRQIQRDQPRYPQAEISRPTPEASRYGGRDDIRSSPRISAPRENRFSSGHDSRGGSSGGRQFRNSRGADGQSGHRFQGRFRN